MKPFGTPMSEEEWKAFSNEITFLSGLCHTTPDYFSAAYAYLRAVATINDIFKIDTDDYCHDLVRDTVCTRTKAVEGLGYVMYAALTKGNAPLAEIEKE